MCITAAFNHQASCKPASTRRLMVDCLLIDCNTAYAGSAKAATNRRLSKKMPAPRHSLPQTSGACLSVKSAEQTTGPMVTNIWQTT